MPNLKTSTNSHRILQCSFNTGEISSDVANRVDMDKYKYALLKAKNAMVRPFGPAYKRAGFMYCVRTKNDGPAILVPFASGNGFDYLLEIGEGYIRVHKDDVWLGVEMTTPYNLAILPKLRFTQSADVMYITSGEYPVKELARYSEFSWQFRDFEIDTPYFDDSLGNVSVDCTVTPSAIDGSITLTASEDLFSAGMVGSAIRLTQDVDTATVSLDMSSSQDIETKTSDSVYVGDTWKIQTSGTWDGIIDIERSFDNVNWKPFRKYTSQNNGNYTESGTVTTKCYLRITAKKYRNSEKNLKVDLMAMAYSHDGWATITEFTDAQNVTATVNDKLGTVNPTKKWALSAWSQANGYPRTSAFFQDRLVFGATKHQPYAVWMSRTSDYGNFGIEKAGGKVTEDSAIAIFLISRKQYEILHMIPGNDLRILTTGNEWIISGNEVASPTNISPKLQTTRGSNDCEPLEIGGKLVYLQARGTTVRDFGYRYEVDHYDGSDLTLLAKHITRKGEIVDSAYKQEPDSTIYFVRDDGIICCLAYIDEQKVNAWSTVETDGKIESVSCIQQGAEDFIYAVIQREINGETVRYIEKMANNPQDSARPNDYIMLDSAVRIINDEATNTLNVNHLKGKSVDVLGDGQMFLNWAVAEDGTVTLPSKVKDAIVGLRYTMEMEMPNIEITVSGSSIMGLPRYVGNVMIRLENSLGGSVGPLEDLQDTITYDEFATAGDIVLYTGDKNVVLPMGGFNQDGRVWIESIHPYPFSILSIIREVFIGG